ncbi:MAG TPA: FkbM family methyltransferase [Acetobacteraceae bacterium]|jgi:FkbM family methyltransferase|nr:FkbM family methyltransferase [Acetobacteraceae bacterium]
MTAITLTANFEYRQLQMVQDLEPSEDATIFGFLNNGMLYEPDVAHLMARVLHDGDVALDVGANIGFFTVMMAALTGPTGRVVAFEPGPDNLVRLRRNIATSGVQNVAIIEQPASDTDGPARFYLNSDVSGGHALWDPGRFPGNTKSQAELRMADVSATTLDSVVAAMDLPAPRLVKIDTEGAEHRVLMGAADLLRDHRVPYIVAELHEFGLAELGSSQRDLRRFMAGFGYDTFCLYFNGAMPKLIPPETDLKPPHFINLLFSTVADVARLWQVERFDPRATVPAQR